MQIKSLLGLHVKSFNASAMAALNHRALKIPVEENLQTR